MEGTREGSPHCPGGAHAGWFFPALGWGSEGSCVPQCTHPPAQERGWRCWAAPSPPHRAPWKGQGGGAAGEHTSKGGVSKPPPPAWQRREAAPTGDAQHQPPAGTRSPSPAETANSSHRWRRAGRPLGGSGSLGGRDPTAGRAPHPDPEACGGAGRARAGSGASAGVPGACSCAGSTRTSSAPAQGPAPRLGRGGDAWGRGDLSQRLMVFQHHRGGCRGGPGGDPLSPCQPPGA